MKIVYLVRTRTLEKHNVIKLFLDVFKPRYEAVEVDPIVTLDVLKEVILIPEAEARALYLTSLGAH